MGEILQFLFVFLFIRDITTQRMAVWGSINPKHLKRTEEDLIDLSVLISTRLIEILIGMLGNCLIATKKIYVLNLGKRAVIDENEKWII